ncbi:MAG: hypothetical protein WC722_17850 [Rhodospirillales bacterium]
MNQTSRDNKAFETKVSNLINATRHLEVSQILLLRRLTMADPESLKWANIRQLDVVFSVILGKAVERMGLDRLREARDHNFEPLLPLDANNRDEDVRILAAISEPMLGQTPPPISEHEALLAKLLAMGPAAAKAPIARYISAIKEPPPLFAAQLGPDSERLMPGGADRMQLDSDEKPYTDFPTLFDDAICSYSRKILGLLQVKGDIKPGRRPFAMAPEFTQCYEEVLRRFVLPPMRASRHIQQLGISHNWPEVGGGKLIEIIQSGEVNNPVLHNWDSRWAAFRTIKGKKPKTEDDPWPLFREDATKGDYSPPSEDNLRLMQDIVRFEAESIAKAWRELGQLYEQEFTPNARQEQAREGAFRDGLMKWISKLPEDIGELLAIKCYYMLPRIDGTFIRRLLTNFGRRDQDRRRAAPILSDFVQTLNE